MYNAFYERTRETILALSKHIRTSDLFRTAVFDGALKCVMSTPCFDPVLGSVSATPDRLEWRVIDHCTAVTRIYAIYEQFAQEMVREHLSLLQARLSFFELPDKIRLSYRSGLAKILDKKDGPRFADLDLAKLISEYDKALSGQSYTIEPRAMLMQEQNLRIPELDRFMNACGVDGVGAWIERHRAVTGFFAANDRLGASAASEMAELIKYRNDAAHGSIDIGDILNINVLLEFCDFVTAVCEALAERVQLAGLIALEFHGYAFTLGKITESLKKGTVCIGPVTGSLKVGSKIYLCGPDYCLERTVLSLQLEGTSHNQVELQSATEVGMMLDAMGKKNSTIMTFERPSSAAA